MNIAKILTIVSRVIAGVCLVALTIVAAVAYVMIMCDPTRPIC